MSANSGNENLKKLLIYNTGVVLVLGGVLLLLEGSLWILSGLSFVFAALLVMPVTREYTVKTIERPRGWNLSTTAVGVLAVSLFLCGAVVVPTLIGLPGTGAESRANSAPTTSPSSAAAVSTMTPTLTESPTAELATSSPTPTQAPTPTPSPTPTTTPTSTPTPTATPTSTPTPTPTPTPTATPAPEPGKITVGYVHADADGNDHENLNDEYVSLRNDGGKAVDLSGWKLSDSDSHTYRFPDGFSLGPGETVTIYTGSGSDSETELYWGSGSAIWNNAGDTVRVTDSSGNVVVEYEYP